MRRVLKAYALYYNQVRTHLALDKDAPEFRQAQPLGDILALPLLGGFHHHYVRVRIFGNHSRTRNHPAKRNIPRKSSNICNWRTESVQPSTIAATLEH